MCRRLQPYVSEAAALCVGGCSPTRWRLQPYAIQVRKAEASCLLRRAVAENWTVRVTRGEAATLRAGGCNPACWRLQPCVPEAATMPCLRCASKAASTATIRASGTGPRRRWTSDLTARCSCASRARSTRRRTARSGCDASKTASSLCSCVPRLCQAASCRPPPGTPTALKGES